MAKQIAPIPLFRKMSSAFTVQPLLHCSFKSKTPLSQRDTTFYLNYAVGTPFTGGRKLTSWCRETRAPAAAIGITASTTETAVVEEAEVSDDVVFRESYNLERTARVEGKITVRLEKGNDEGSWQLSVGCSLPGKWLLHWGVTYFGDVGSEWDQPPPEMIPAGSVRVKDYAIESPLEKSTQEEGEDFYEVKIDFNTNSSIASINFVLKDEVSGSWHQHRGRDFKIPLTGAKKGAFEQLSNTLLKSEESRTEEQNQKSELEAQGETTNLLEGFYEEHSIVKETQTKNIVNVFVKQNQETAKNVLSIETDLPGDVVVHWGVCNGESRKWELPQEPYPSETVVFRNKALRTPLKRGDGLSKASGSFGLDVGHTGFVFVLKLNDNTWLNLMGKDFYVPLLSPVTVDSQSEPVELSQMTETDTVQSNDIIREIRSLVSGISLKKNRTLETKEAQEVILQEIEKLAAEAYSIFRGSVPGFEGDPALEVIEPAKVISGIGTGFEVVCQGFNWESNKSGKWYMELYERAEELASLGFTVIWLPPPTDSVSPEGYMPRDLYNLNSRYGTMDELKTLVKRFHEVGIKVLGDAVLNHRCAQHQNQNGVWNIFGGRLNWDDRAVVADDPHFQGRGNKSSGDNFHAAPNIDHSQDFVRKDIKEWLLWMRDEIGYDGWRLDFVRGFWGGYVKDYLEATEPYFAVGEFWDSLSYTYGEMDHNQDAHRQRIVDWISATGGTASAFDVTTKGILHATLERCEYWRLSDGKGKPPGVVGWWPSRAITFIENHDTGSTQGHWRFPGGKEMQGYAYILTHPGTPSVFFDHIFSDFGSEIATLISLRNRKMINCRSTLKIVKAERDVYAAIIDDKVAMKIGPGHFEPDGNWSFVTEGRDYKLWEAS